MDYFNNISSNFTNYMKDQHGNKITEHEFTKDIGHRTENPVEILDAGFERVMKKCYGENWRDLPKDTKPIIN